jgi:hypothetical protein
MRRKFLQDIANTLCQMLVGWRMGDDLETFAQLPDGTLEVDCLKGTAHHSVSGPVSMLVASELTAWLGHRLEVHRFPSAELRTATVTARIRTDRIATNRKRVVSFDFAVESRVATTSHEYLGALTETHAWHTRVGAA